jgi:hypothetical protein
MHLYEIASFAFVIAVIVLVALGAFKAFKMFVRGGHHTENQE